VLVEKEVIRPGTYWYTDQQTGLPRKLVVTPELTKHWHEEGSKMLGLGLTIPLPCEHDFNAHPMTPADRLKNNAGWVKEYRRKGDVLFAACDIQDEEIAKKLPKTIRWTSPWFSSFTDGEGRKWDNVISHLCLTTRPRIVKQSPFTGIAAALSLATETKIEDAVGKDGFCLSRIGRLVERKKDKKLRPVYPVAFAAFSLGVPLAGDDKPLPDLDAADDEPPEDDAAGEDVEPASPFASPSGDVSMEELLCDLLSALGIHLENSGGEAEFKRALYNAAMQKIHELTNGGKGQGVGDTNNQPNTGSNNTPPNPLVQQEQQPMYMSLEEIHKITDPTMKGIALAMYTENQKLRAEMEASNKTTASLRDIKLREENAKRASRVALLGKLSPHVKADLDTMLALPAMALSMGDGGSVIDPMAQTLQVLEKGLADLPTMLTTDRMALAVQPQPTDQSMLSDADSDKLADEMARMMGCPPEQKKAG